MNTLKFEVYKNTLKRRDGFNPVLGEKKYTKIQCYFMESDWDNCALVTANFMSEKDNIVKSTVSLTTLETVVSSPMVSSLGFNYTLCSLSYHKKYDETREDTSFTGFRRKM